MSVPVLHNDLLQGCGFYVGICYERLLYRHGRYRRRLPPERGMQSKGQADPLPAKAGTAASSEANFRLTAVPPVTTAGLWLTAPPRELAWEVEVYRDVITPRDSSNSHDLLRDLGCGDQDLFHSLYIIEEFGVATVQLEHQVTT